jgi:parallel beta-helix repeat protein
VFHDLIGPGVYLWFATEAVIEDNIFYGEQGGGVFIHNGSSQTITGNTFIGTDLVGGGAPVSLWLEEDAHPVVANNIFALSSGTGVSCLNGATATFVCNDAWGNAQNYVGCPDPTGTSGNISADPLFCDPVANDFRLRLESPCLPENSPQGCGLIGALGACEIAAGVSDAGLAVLNFSVTPNPVRGRAVVTYSGQLRAPTVEIYNSAGRVVDIIEQVRSPYAWIPSVSTPPGVYFVRLRANEGSATSKFVLLPR